MWLPLLPKDACGGETTDKQGRFQVSLPTPLFAFLTPTTGQGSLP